MRRHWLKGVGSLALATALAGAAGAQAQENDWSDFNYWDNDTSGDISQEEWDGGMAEIDSGRQDDQGQAGNQEDERAIYNMYMDYNSIDANDDSMIDEQEFEAFRNDMQQQQE